MTITWSETDNEVFDTEEISLQKLLQFKISGASHGPSKGNSILMEGGEAVGGEGGGEIKLE